MAFLRRAFAAACVALAACEEASTNDYASPAETETAVETLAPSPNDISQLDETTAPVAEAFVPGDGPALWLTGDDDTTIYLFGTIHVLPPNLKWRTPTFDQAFDAADTVYFETPIDDNDPQLASLVMQYGMFPPGQSLRDLLDDEDEAVLADAAARVGMPMIGLDRMRPWMAGVSLSVAFIQAEGHDPNSGVERQLAPAARLDGKRLRYFETSEEQIRFFADLPVETQLDFLMEGVRQIDQASDLLDRMDMAWISGDVDALGALMLEDQSTSAPIVYDVLIRQRNAAWAAIITELAASEPGVFMIAVGAGHIAGEDSLALMLSETGLVVERIQ
ncbi:MAG: TraB/GumN family protein [Pseudomonadota bacterium]